MKFLNTKAIFATFILSSIILGACGDSDDNPQEDEQVKSIFPAVTVPQFNADSAYFFVGKQVSFGPRVPGTPAQQECANWMEEKLKSYCDTVYRQTTTLVAGDGITRLPCINLIGSINPQATKRVLLLAHWDSRPWADEDTKDTDKPILGADDGGSGVGVLLELARVIKLTPLDKNLGIDILLTDVEDYGRTEWKDESYALGTQYWARNPHVAGYKADYGILLDMVGGKAARFPKEGISRQYAADVQDKVWNAANRAGFSSYFSYQMGDAITDDHVPINKITGIPTIDIIHLPANKIASPFPSHWHTHQDNMDVIDRSTLNAVGQSLLQVLYEEAAPAT